MNHITPLSDLLRLKEELSHDPAPSNAPAQPTDSKSAHPGTTVTTKVCPVHQTTYTEVRQKAPAFLADVQPELVTGSCPQCSAESDLQARAQEIFQRERWSPARQKQLFELRSQIAKQYEQEIDEQISATWNKQAAQLQQDCEDVVRAQYAQRIAADAEASLQQLILEEVKQHQSGGNQ